MDMYIPGERITGQVMLHEETMKRIAGEAVEKAFVSLSSGQGDEYEAFVDSVAEHAKFVVKDITKKAVERIIYEKYAKDIESIVRGVGADIMRDFTENLGADLRERLRREINFYKEASK